MLVVGGGGEPGGEEPGGEVKINKMELDSFLFFQLINLFPITYLKKPNKRVCW